jgi:hypothetical protein
MMGCRTAKREVSRRGACSGCGQFAEGFALANRLFTVAGRLMNLCLLYPQAHYIRRLSCDSFHTTYPMEKLFAPLDERSRLGERPAIVCLAGLPWPNTLSLSASTS